MNKGLSYLVQRQSDTIQQGCLTLGKSKLHLGSGIDYAQLNVKAG